MEMSRVSAPEFFSLCYIQRIEATGVQTHFNFFKGLCAFKSKNKLLAYKGGLRGCQTLVQVHPALHDVTLL